MPTNTSPALPANPDQVLASLLIQNQTQTSLMQQHLESFLAAMTALQTKLTQLPFQFLNSHRTPNVLPKFRMVKPGTNCFRLACRLYRSQ